MGKVIRYTYLREKYSAALRCAGNNNKGLSLKCSSNRASEVHASLK
jgi:hypothetical protein